VSLAQKEGVCYSHRAPWDHCSISSK